MIQESHEWKKAIKRNNSYIRRMSKNPIDEEDLILDRIQIRIVSNALYVRRLLETPTVASSLSHESINITAYPWTGKVVDYMNNHHFDKAYQINNPRNKDVLGSTLCNQIIHSFVWVWIVDDVEDIISGFMVSSDRKRHSELYTVQLDDFRKFTQNVANSWPTKMTGKRNRETGQWEFQSW